MFIAALFTIARTWKQGDTAESHVRDGVITIASLPPHASISSWTTERLAHQMPDALYRVGSQPGGPSMCPMHRTTEKDPRQKSRISAWMGGATEKDWPKRPNSKALTVCRWHDTGHRNPKDSIKKLLGLFSEFSKVTGYKINKQKSLAFLFTKNEQSEREIKESIPPLQQKE